MSLKLLMLRTPKENNQIINLIKPLKEGYEKNYKRKIRC